MLSVVTALFISTSHKPVEPVQTVLTGSLHVPSPAKNFKLSVIFDHPVKISRVQLETCGREWSDGINVFASPGIARVFIEGGRSKIDARLLSEKTQSVAIVFGRDNELCLKNLKFLDDKDQPIELATAQSIPAEIQDADRLFDSRPDTIQTLEDPAKVKFDTEQTFDRAIIWTGGTNLYAHTLKLTGDKNWHETLPLRNDPSAQEVIFKHPFKGRSLTLVAPDAGEVGEIEFALGTKVGSPLATVDERKTFETSMLNRTLDFDWATEDDEKWIFRLRADGSFFIRGFNDDSKQAKNYAATGSYTIIRSAANRVRLKLNGVRFTTALLWDGVSCPYSCGSEGSLDGATRIDDTILLEKINEGSMMVRNRTPRSQRGLTFTDLRMRRTNEE